jgi:anti-sigma regulatory factor (Ser/Thr protein kinase)
LGPVLGGNHHYVVMEETLQLRLAGGTDAPRRARSALSALNGTLSDLHEEVKLLVSELVTNSVVHAGAGSDGLLELRLAVSPEQVRAELIDPGPGFRPPSVLPEPGAGGRFGLFLVERFATRWGTESDPARVWFEIDR